MRVLIAYGDDPFYWQAAFYQAAIAPSDMQVLVVSDRPERYRALGSNVQTLQIAANQVSDWSLAGQYHFRVKTQALIYATQQIKSDKYLFTDSDIVLRPGGMGYLLAAISEKTCVLFRNEGRILGRKRFAPYHNWVSNPATEMWGSAIIGLTRQNTQILTQADDLLLKLLKSVDAHTVEQFSLSETAVVAGLDLVEGRKWTQHFSTSGRRRYAQARLSPIFDLPESKWVAACLTATPMRGFWQTVMSKLA